jgi:hypothetical protein
MKLPDGTTLLHGDLEHRAPYDARKAHEYYLRTRRLKGRKAKIGELPVRPLAAVKEAGKAAAPKKGITRRKADKAYLSSVSAKLKELNASLKQKMADAQSAKTSFKTPKKAEDDTTPTAEELQKQISTLQGRLTSAVEQLKKLTSSAPQSG